MPMSHDSDPLVSDAPVMEDAILTVSATVNATSRGPYTQPSPEPMAFLPAARRTA